MSDKKEKVHKTGRTVEGKILTKGLPEVPGEAMM